MLSLPDKLMLPSLNTQVTFLSLWIISVPNFPATLWVLLWQTLCSSHEYPQHTVNWIFDCQLHALSA